MNLLTVPPFSDPATFYLQKEPSNRLLTARPQAGRGETAQMPARGERGSQEGCGKGCEAKSQKE